MYMFLCRHAGNRSGHCTKSHREIADAFGISTDTVSRNISILEDEKLIGVQVFPDNHREYVILEVEKHCPQNADRVPANSGQHCPQNADSYPQKLDSNKEGRLSSKLNHKTKPPARPTRGQGIVNNSSRSKATNETRHERIHQIVMGWYQEWADVECPWNGQEAQQLKRMLSATPNWTDAQIVTCLTNLAKSDCVPRGDRPGSWLNKLPKFLHGALDQYWHPLGGNGNGSERATSKAEQRVANISATTRSVFTEARGTLSDPPTIDADAIGRGRTKTMAGDSKGLFLPGN